MAFESVRSGSVQAALAAVASSRMGSDKKKERAGLPREWRGWGSEDLTAQPVVGKDQKVRGGSAESGLTLRETPRPATSMDRAPSSMSRYSAGGGAGGGLMRESLVTFETAARGDDELIRGAMSVVNAAERVQGVMRNGNSRALEEQINAEVEGYVSYSCERIYLYSLVLRATSNKSGGVSGVTFVRV